MLDWLGQVGVGVEATWAEFSKNIRLLQRIVLWGWEWVHCTIADVAHKQKEIYLKPYHLPPCLLYSLYHLENFPSNSRSIRDELQNLTLNDALQKYISIVLVGLQALN